MKIRPSAAAGLFYARDPLRLQATVSELLGSVPRSANVMPKALIAPHAPEQSLEVELPLLQALLPSFAVVPLVIGDAKVQDVAEVLQRLWGGPETLIVVSSDLSHYHDYDTARRIDAATAAAIERAEWENLGPDQACGFLAVAGLLAETSRRRLAPQRLALCNS